MTTKPSMKKFTELAEMLVQKYERYLPNAFDNSLSILEKLNKVIEYLKQVRELTNDVVKQWNEVMEWMTSGAIDETINAKLDEMETDGTLSRIINIDVLNEKADKTYVENEVGLLETTIQNLSETMDTSLGEISDSLSDKANATELVTVTNRFKPIEDFINSGYINAKFPPAPLIGVKGDGVTDDSLALQKIVDLGKPVYVPPNKYKIKNTVKLKAFDFVGSGLATTFDIDGCDAFSVIDSGGRKVVQIGNFSIITTTDNCNNFAAFKTEQYVTDRIVGLKFFNLEIGGGGIFGCGFHIYNTFRLSIEHVGMTSCINGIILEGQVVQASLIEVTSNMENPNKPTTINNGNRNGLTLKASTYSGSKQNPESVKCVNCSFVGHDWGVYQNAATFASYHGMDLDYNQQGGFYVAESYGGCTFKDSWIANSGGTQATYGIKVDLPDFNRNPVTIENVHISWLNSANINSVGVQTEQYRKSVSIKNVTVSGGANIKHGFRIKSPVEMVFMNNRVADGVCTDAEYNIDGADRSIFNYNYGKRMSVHGDGSWMEVRSNMVDTLTTTGSNTIAS